jgi:hypothetical protein
MQQPARFRCFDDVRRLARNLTEKRRSESMKRNDEGGATKLKTMHTSDHVSAHGSARFDLDG